MDVSVFIHAFEYIVTYDEVCVHGCTLVSPCVTGVTSTCVYVGRECGGVCTLSRVYVSRCPDTQEWESLHVCTFVSMYVRDRT